MDVLTVLAVGVAFLSTARVLLWDLSQRLFPDAAKGPPPDFWERP